MGRSREKILIGIERMQDAATPVTSGCTMRAPKSGGSSQPNKTCFVERFVNLNMLNKTEQPLIILFTLNHYSSLVIY